MRIAVGSDHGGFELKQILIDHLKSLHHESIDVGCYSKEPVDYPDLAAEVAHKILGKTADTGIMIDGAGIGSTMAANKIRGIRAALCNDIYTARNSKEHNDANMLVIGSMVVGPGKARQIVEVFLVTQFQGGRHQKRVDKIMQLEESPERRESIDSTALSELIKNVVQSVVASPAADPAADFANPAAPATPPSRLLITEDFLRERLRKGDRDIALQPGAIVTPLAKDFARDHKIVLH
jgi:ribose 5-phosphate isomerase B